MALITYDPAGAQVQQVGPVYDIALGYFDPATQLVKMYGYTVSPSGNEDEGVDVTDEQHLIQIASPNSTDRFARFPQVSQGDWSKGERQRLYGSADQFTAAMYYQSDGNVDVSTPGNLTLFPGIRTDTFTLNGVNNYAPMQTDGSTVYLGIKSGANNFAQLTGGAPVLSNTVAAGAEIYDLLYTPFALLGLAATGLWIIVNGNPPTTSQMVTETFTMPEFPVKAMAYMQNGTVDNVYYINNSQGSSFIKSYTRSTNLVATLLTATATERFYQAICSSQSGIFFATTSKLPFQNFFYSWDGGTGTPLRIAAVMGRVEYCLEALGTVYVLVRPFQSTYNTNPNYVLYAVAGSNVSIVDSAVDFVDANFVPTCTSVDTYNANAVPPGGDFRPTLWYDGRRFLYISWAGLATRRVDLLGAGISQIGPNTSGGQANVHAHSFITAATVPYTDVTSFGTTMKVSQFSAAATSGTLTWSFVDFESPGTGKPFRAIEFQTSKALAGSQAVTFAFRLDQTASFTALTTVQIGARTYAAYFPAVTKGTEVQVQITLTADAPNGAPVVTNVTLIADVGRVINITVSCRRQQKSRSQDQEGVTAQPYSAKDLQANLMNIRKIGGGRGYAFIADPTISTGVDQIQIRLVDYHRTTPTGAATGLRSVDGSEDMEVDVALSLIESFDP